MMLSMYVYVFYQLDLHKSPDRVEYDLVRLLFEAFSLSHLVVDVMEGETVKTRHTWPHCLQPLGDSWSRINSSHW